MVKNNLAIATSVNDRVFGKSFVFYPGRLYFNYKGNPVQLNNMRMDSAEAQALVELMFRPSEQEQSLDYFSIFKNPEAFEKYLRDLINQVDNNDRIYFIKNNKFGQPGEPAIIVKRVQVVGSKRTYFTLTPKETLDFLNKSYYKVDKTLLEDNNVMPRFSMQEGEILVDDESSYVNYVFQTHEMPMVAGKPYSLVNKTVMLNEEDLQNTGKTLGAALQKQTPTPPAVVKTPPPVPKTTTTSFVDKDGYEILHTDSDPESTIVTSVVYFPTREESVQILKNNSTNPKYVTILENMTDLEYYSLLKKLGTEGFPNPNYRDSNKQKKEYVDGRMISVEGDMLVVELPDNQVIALGLVGSEKGSTVIKFNYNMSRESDKVSSAEDEGASKVLGLSVKDKQYGVRNLADQPSPEKELELFSTDDLPETIEDEVSNNQETVLTSKKDLLQKEKQEAIDRITDIENNLLPKINSRLENNLQPELSALYEKLRNTKDKSLKDEIQESIDKLNKLRLSRADKVDLERRKEALEGQIVSAKRFIAEKDAELNALEASQETELSKEPSTSIANPFIEFTNDVDSKEAEETKEDCKGPSTAPKSLVDRLNQNISSADSKAIKGDEQKTTRRPRK